MYGRDAYGRPISPGGYATGGAAVFGGIMWAAYVYFLLACGIVLTIVTALIVVGILWLLRGVIALTVGSIIFGVEANPRRGALWAAAALAAFAAIALAFAHAWNLWEPARICNATCRSATWFGVWSAATWVLGFVLASVFGWFGREYESTTLVGVLLAGCVAVVFWNHLAAPHVGAAWQLSALSRNAKVLEIERDWTIVQAEHRAQRVAAYRAHHLPLPADSP